MWATGCSGNIVFFLIVKILHFRQHWASIVGCTENSTPIRVTVYPHWVKLKRSLATIWSRGMVCSGLWKTQFFPNTLYYNPIGTKYRLVKEKAPPIRCITFLCPLFLNSLKLLIQSGHRLTLNGYSH